MEVEAVERLFGIPMKRETYIVLNDFMISPACTIGRCGWTCTKYSCKRYSCSSGGGSPVIQSVGDICSVRWSSAKIQQRGFEAMDDRECGIFWWLDFFPESTSSTTDASRWSPLDRP